MAVLGIAFKAETSDIRESRSIAVITGLLQKGASVRVYDPAAMEGGRRELGSSVTYSTSARDCLSGADVAITMTAWREFKRLLPRDFVRLMRSPVIVDARRVFDPAKYSRGLNYAALGRGADETR